MRIKLPDTDMSRARAEEILAQIAKLTIERREAQNALDRTVTAAKEKAEPRLSELGSNIEALARSLEGWAGRHPEEFPPGRKSLRMAHGTIGWRTGMPKLRLLSRWTWEKVLGAIRDLGRPMSGFVRVKEEANKEAIITAITEGHMEPALARQIGVGVVQEEAFFVEPDLSEQDATTMTTATAAPAAIAAVSK